ncbi:MAG: sigma-70 family RNA polymerase sigma factor, partial [Thermoanaerobaculia bacterium]
IYAYVLARVGRRADAEDLTSDVFRRALSALARFEWRGAPFSAWLFRIAANAVAGHFAARPGSGEAGDPPSETDLEADIAKAERRALLYGAVHELPEDQRRVVTLRFSEEQSIRETARQLGKSEGAVKQLQLRALRNLKDRMGEVHG